MPLFLTGPLFWETLMVPPNIALEPTRTDALGPPRVSEFGCVFEPRGSALER
jgi:hypothetical protein